MNQLTKNSTNEQIQKVFGNALADGKTRIFAMNPSENNPDRITLFMCQEIEASSTATEAQSFFLGWGQRKRLLRAVFSADKAIVQKLGLKAGSVVPFDILVEEKTIPAYEGQNPKVNPSTGEVITHEGMPVYEHASLVAIGQGAKVVTLERDTTVNANLPGSELLK